MDYHLGSQPPKVWNKDFVFPTNIPDQISNQTIKQISQISLGGEAIRLVLQINMVINRFILIKLPWG